jgi:hypothetical protein
MKVIRNTQDELVLESRPWGAGIVVIMLTLGVLGAGLTVFMNGSQVSGLVIILFGGILSLSAFWAFVRLEEVRLSRSDAIVQFRTRTIAGRHDDSLSLDTVRGAVMQVRTRQERSKSRKGRGTNTRTVRMFRPALQITGPNPAERPLSEVYTGDEAVHQAVVQAVNGWLGLAGAGQRPDPVLDPTLDSDASDA